MRILFLHDNFPAQFGHFARFLSAEGWDVLFGTQREGASAPGLKTFTYKPHRAPARQTHPYARSFEKAVLSAQAVARAGLTLEQRDLRPDIVMAHSGWGPGMYVKDIWPDCAYVGFFEWYYRANAPDVAFLGGDERGLDARLAGQTRNAAILSDLARCDGAIVPTAFQKSQFPPLFDDVLTVLHDGVDTDYYSPGLPDQPLAASGTPDHAEIITYVARGMEPYRGFPDFMRVLERVLRERPGAHAIIVGEDRVAYGSKLADGDSYKKRAQENCDLDWDRVHFTGLLPQARYRDVLRASHAHVYFTAPFVLSWSMMEAMSVGAPLVASAVAPVEEVAGIDRGAISLVDHRRHDEAANAIIAQLKDRDAAVKMGRRARGVIERCYAQRDVFPRKRDWLLSLALP